MTVAPTLRHTCANPSNLRQPPCANPLRQTRQPHAETRTIPCARLRHRCAIPPLYINIWVPPLGAAHPDLYRSFEHLARVRGMRESVGRIVLFGSSRERAHAMTEVLTSNRTAIMGRHSKGVATFWAQIHEGIARQRQFDAWAADLDDDNKRTLFKVHARKQQEAIDAGRIYIPKRPAYLRGLTCGAIKGWRVVRHDRVMRQRALCLAWRQIDRAKNDRGPGAGIGKPEIGQAKAREVTGGLNNGIFQRSPRT